MSEARVVDQHAPRFALGAPDVLAAFNRAGVLHAADVHIAMRLAALGGEGNGDVVLAAALAARAPRAGHVHADLQRIEQSAALDLEELLEPEALPWPEPAEWIERVAASPLVGIEDQDPERPLRLWASRLYLDRYWRDEKAVAVELLDRGAAEVAPVSDALQTELARLFPEGTDTAQARAAAAAVAGRLTVVAGGPGTGKTTTVARVAALLSAKAADAGESLPLIGLAAPTGKAAQRLGEAVLQALPDLDVSTEVRQYLERVEAMTLHRLLGRRAGSHSRFRHDRENRLPHDVVIVDETSMVSLSMMARLLEAVRPDSRLVLVGDPDQLASVEAGAVLGDIVGSTDAGQEGNDEASSLGSRVVTLDHVYRFGGPLADLAAAVRVGNPDAVLDLLSAGHEEIHWIEADVADAASVAQLDPIRERVVSTGRKTFEAAVAADAAGALTALGEHRVLCAHRRGPYGVAGWNPRIESWLAGEVEGYHPFGRRYLGRPVLVTENNYELNLFNGDTGVIVRAEEGDDRVVAAFERGPEVIRLGPSQLDGVDTVHAMTIHKSQGSQFDGVTVLLPPPESRILTRELLYTAVTRSQGDVTVVATRPAVESAVRRQVARASALRERLEQ